MGESLREYCSRCGAEALLEQWHMDRNAPLTPDDVSYGSKRMLWWRCAAGHQWQSPPYARVGKGSGCPYCAGKRVAPGYDLAAMHPLLAAQWHGERNMPHSPDQILPGSHKLVWWRCARGHEWRAAVRSRVEGSGCPVCSGRKVVPGENDLASCAPLLAAQWHPTKNGALTPDRVSCGAARKVWWRCGRGHEWQATVSARAAGKGCPVCAGQTVLPGQTDLRSQFPDLAEQWHGEKNAPLGPEEVTPYSNRRVWWRCERGHAWQAPVSSRTERRTGCPYCTGRKVLPGFNDLKTIHPLVAAQWHPTRNAPLRPDMVLPGSAKKVWWRCSDGHEWKAVVYSRTGPRKSGCPVCAGRPVKPVEQ